MEHVRFPTVPWSMSDSQRYPGACPIPNCTLEHVRFPTVPFKPLSENIMRKVQNLLNSGSFLIYLCCSIRGSLVRLEKPKFELINFIARKIRISHLSLTTDHVPFKKRTCHSSLWRVTHFTLNWLRLYSPFKKEGATFRKQTIIFGTSNSDKERKTIDLVNFMVRASMVNAKYRMSCR